MDYEPETVEENELLNCFCDEFCVCSGDNAVGICTSEDVYSCKLCYSIAKLVKERALLMPLAADGKPIMPGDTVENIHNGDRYQVLYLKFFDDATLVAIRYKDYAPFFVTADSVTHVSQTRVGGCNVSK